VLNTLQDYEAISLTPDTDTPHAGASAFVTMTFLLLLMKLAVVLVSVPETSILSKNIPPDLDSN